MARIRASCGTCGDVELTTAEVSVQICADDGQGSYSFRCPTCSVAVSKPAEARIIELLVSSGVRMSTWSMPAELAEPRTGDPITHDDLLDFHALLETEDWLDRLNRITRL
ncbi:MAG: hypothetical protein JWN46_1643 [Acidimicrobiales bacterium]|nr:hypothetical protein [Acidimicrobiales bacterium]